MKNKPKLIVVLGPTATGKSDLAVQIAKDFDGEIISADSRQVYRGLDIGSGKITKKEMRGVPHYLLDVASPKRKFSVAEFKKLGEIAIKNILSKDLDPASRGLQEGLPVRDDRNPKIPIICGGTGFYIDALVYDLNFPKVKADIKLRKELNKKSLEELQKILKKLDSKRFKEIDIKNKVRIIRAIEIVTHLGKIKKLKPNLKYNVLFIGIDYPDEILKERVMLRIHKRMKGMKREVKKLRESGLSLKRMKELGLEYRNLALLYEKKITEKEFVEKLFIEIWHFVKRQRTWWKRNPVKSIDHGTRKNIKWFVEPRYEDIKKEIEGFL